MGSKRPNCGDIPLHGSFMNLVTGQVHDIDINKDFVIGRSLTCSILVEGLYISRLHCTVKYVNDQFVLSDNNTSSGTFINLIKLSAENNNSVVLKHGDIISFGDKRKMEFIYKFCLSTKPDKKSKLECVKEKKDVSGNIHNLNERYENSLKTLHTEVLMLKRQSKIMFNDTLNYVSEFKQMLNLTIEYAQKSKAESILHQSIIEHLTNELNQSHNALKIQQENLVNNSMKEKNALAMYKIKLNELLENDCQCPICNEVIFKAHIVNCHHTFCESCISTWLKKNKVCPVCRSPVKTNTHCLFIDNFLTNLCDVIGGSTKAQRDNLKQERNIPKIIGPQTAKRGRGRPNNRNRLLEEVQIIDLDRLREPLSRARHGVIDVVDLTNSISTP